MKINCTTGTPEQMLNEFRARIDELDGIGIDSSFDYPDDLVDLENGEYESHATEPVNSSFVYPEDLEAMEDGEYVSHMTEPVSAAISYDDLNVEEDVVQEVLEFLGSKGYDTSNREVRNYADAVAEYIDMSRQAYQSMGEESPYTLDQWYDDTLMNYPYELEDLPTV